MSESNEEPELVVDTDWKSQVEKEKEVAKESAEAADDDPTADQWTIDQDGNLIAVSDDVVW